MGHREYRVFRVFRESVEYKVNRGRRVKPGQQEARAVMGRTELTAQMGKTAKTEKTEKTEQTA